VQALRLTLMCHARTAAQKVARFPLDEPVEIDWQALRGSRAASYKRAPTLLCGPETRTRQTAELFAGPATVVDALRDCDFGRWRGVRINDLQRDEPQALQTWLADRDVVPHGGESVAQLCARVEDWLQSLQGQTGHVLAITHPFVIRAALCKVMHALPVAFNTLDVEPLAAVELRFNGRWRLRLAAMDFEEELE